MSSPMSVSRMTGMGEAFPAGAACAAASVAGPASASAASSERVRRQSSMW